ncbi:MAG: VCBS repeat-containing protein [Candidatus Hydrogenedentes bacterium]|nr:VCBS repeat-containing protein [Candidatus Hydrogenedentota bacterium]
MAVLKTFRRLFFRQPAALLLLMPCVLHGCAGSETETLDTDAARQAAKPARAPQIDFLKYERIGNPPPEGVLAMITHLDIVDLDQDGLPDVIFSDANTNTVCWLQQKPAGTFTERVLAENIKGPTHLSAVDIDQDGDLDILVASMGIVPPSNEEIGAVVVLENDGQQRFTVHYLAEGIARVTDVRAGDFDGDGDLDLVVGQFGYERGEIRWMEKLDEDWLYRSHNLLNLSGTIHTPVADMDGDGDLDIVALVSQEWEEVYIFENDGKANFTAHRVFGSTNEDFGSSGLNLADLDGDGDLDILFTNGDSFDYQPPGPRPWHGIQWLENKGNLEFEYHRIDDFAGAASGHAVDIDNDGDLDIIVTSSLGQDESSTDASIIWFENDGKMNFTRRDITRYPAHLIVMAPGDIDGDGRVDFVTGSYPTAQPYDRENRISLWRNHWGEASPAESGEAP